MPQFLNWRREFERLKNKLRPHHLWASDKDIEDAIEAAIEPCFHRGYIFDCEDQFRALLFVVSNYCLLTARKKVRRRKDREVNMDQAKRSLMEDEIIQVFENRDLIDMALSLLTKQDCELILDRFENGVTMVEIAGKRGVTIASIESRSKRALKKIRRKIK
jgi:RNA polymerase sigma factor (sigma-70 family)